MHCFIMVKNKITIVKLTQQSLSNRHRECWFRWSHFQQRKSYSGMQAGSKFSPFHSRAHTEIFTQYTESERSRWINKHGGGACLGSLGSESVFDFCACNHSAACRFDIHSGNDEAGGRAAPRLIQFRQCVMPAFASTYLSSRFCSVFLSWELAYSEWHHKDVCYACADIATWSLILAADSLDYLQQEKQGVRTWTFEWPVFRLCSH